MNKMILSSLFLLLSIAAHAKTSLLIDVKMEATDKFSLANASATEATGTDSTARMNLTIEVDQNGKKSTVSQGGEIPAQVNQSQLKEISGSSVRFIDQKNQVDMVVNANVDRSFFLQELNSISIPSEQVQNIMSKSIKTLGSQLVTMYNVSNKTHDISYSLTFSDYNCARADLLLSCNLTADMKIQATEK